MEQESEPIHPGPWGEFPDRYWSTYFGEKAPYYMGELDKLRNGHPLEFRWAVFFLGLFWSAYRKMYVITFCVLMIILLENTLEEGLFALLGIGEQLSTLLGYGISIAINIVSGLYANRVYLWDARRNIRQVFTEAPHLHEMDLIARITKRGGTSIGAAVLLLVGGVVIVLIAASLFTLASE